MGALLKQCLRNNTHLYNLCERRRDGIIAINRKFARRRACYRAKILLDLKQLIAELLNAVRFIPAALTRLLKHQHFGWVDNYREAYSLFACTGILFNYESPLGPSRFVTQKIITVAKRIASGSREKLRLGRMDIARDWGLGPNTLKPCVDVAAGETG